MSDVLKRAPSRKPSRQLKRRAWSAWSNGGDQLRVQVNEPALAKAFAKVPGVTRTGYSVMGPFTAIYLTPHTRDWVQDWMKGHNNGAEAKPLAAPTPKTTPLHEQRAIERNT
jgi:hypothetical protein